MCAQPGRALPAGGGPRVRERPLDAGAGRIRPAPNHQRRRALATHVVLKHSIERRPLDAPKPAPTWAPAAAFAAALANPVLLAACTQGFLGTARLRDRDVLLRAPQSASRV